MIPYKLKEDTYKNHPMDGKYGTIITNTPYANYPVTIVDNHEEVVNGKYTNKPTLCLLHLSEDVRTYTRLRLFDEFLYISFAFSKPTFKMYEYKKEKLTNEKIISVLKNVFYFLQPSLQSHSLVGSTSKELEDDPNYYEGSYVLNNEEEYTILKCRKTFKFYKGKKKYYPNWKETEDLLFEGEINFDLYKLALEVARLKAKIVTNTNQLLEDENDDSIARYQTLKKQLNKQLEIEMNS
jgi:hypothetical protein